MKPSQISELTPDEAARHVAQGAFLLDVREPDEWAEVHVEGAHLIPLDQVAARTAELPRDREVVVICRSGRRSGIAAEQLHAAGFSNVANLVGGILAWQRSGLAVASAA